MEEATLCHLGAIPAVTDFNGEIFSPGMSATTGPFEVYMQAVIVAPAQPLGYKFYNAVEAQFLP